MMAVLCDYVTRLSHYCLGWGEKQLSHWRHVGGRLHHQTSLMNRPRVMGNGLGNKSPRFTRTVLRGRLKHSARTVRAQCNYLGVWP